MLKQHLVRCSNTLNSEINTKATKTFECDKVLLFLPLLYFQSQNHKRNKKIKPQQFISFKIAIILLAVFHYHKLLKCISGGRDASLKILSDTPHYKQNTAITK